MRTNATLLKCWNKLSISIYIYGVKRTYRLKDVNKSRRSSLLHIGGICCILFLALSLSKPLCVVSPVLSRSLLLCLPEFFCYSLSKGAHSHRHKASLSLPDASSNYPVSLQLLLSEFPQNTLRNNFQQKHKRGSYTRWDSQCVCKLLKKKCMRRVRI